MKAITVELQKPCSALLEDEAEPEMRDASIFVEAIVVGVCGTERRDCGGEIRLGIALGKSCLVLCYESLGLVIILAQAV